MGLGELAPLLICHEAAWVREEMLPLTPYPLPSVADTYITLRKVDPVSCLGRIVELTLLLEVQRASPVGLRVGELATPTSSEM